MFHHEEGILRSDIVIKVKMHFIFCIFLYSIFYMFHHEEGILRSDIVIKVKRGKLCQAMRRERGKCLPPKRKQICICILDSLVATYLFLNLYFNCFHLYFGAYKLLFLCILHFCILQYMHLILCIFILYCAFLYFAVYLIRPGKGTD